MPDTVTLRLNTGLYEVPKENVEKALSAGYSHVSPEEVEAYDKEKAYKENTSSLERQAKGAVTGAASQLLALPAMASNLLPGVEGQSGHKWLANITAGGGITPEEAEERLRIIAKHGSEGHLVGEIAGMAFGSKGAGALSKAGVKALGKGAATKGMAKAATTEVGKRAGMTAESVAQHIGMANEQAFVDDLELTTETIAMAAAFGGIGPLVIMPLASKGMKLAEKGAHKIDAGRLKAATEMHSKEVAEFQKAFGRVEEKTAKLHGKQAKFNEKFEASKLRSASDYQKKLTAVEQKTFDLHKKADAKMRAVDERFAKAIARAQSAAKKAAKMDAKSAAKATGKAARELEKVEAEWAKAAQTAHNRLEAVKTKSILPANYRGKNGKPYKTDVTKESAKEAFEDLASLETKLAEAKAALGPARFEKDITRTTEAFGKMRAMLDHRRKIVPEPVGPFPRPLGPEPVTRKLNAPVGPFPRPEAPTFQRPAKFSDIFAAEPKAQLNGLASILEEGEAAATKTARTFQRMGERVGGSIKSGIHGPSVKQGGMGLGGSTTGGALIGSIVGGDIIGAAVGGAAGAAVRHFGPQAAGWALRNTAAAVRQLADKAGHTALHGAKRSISGKDFLMPLSAAVGRSTYRARLKYVLEQSSAEVDSYLTNPESLVEGIGETFGELENVSPEIVPSITNQYLRALGYLKQSMPAQPLLHPGMPHLGTRSIPIEQMESYIRKVRAVQNPLAILADLENGTLHQDTVDAMNMVYPSMMLDIKLSIAGQLASATEPLPRKQAMAFESILGAPGSLYGANNPGFQARLGILDEERQQEQQQGGQGAKPGRATGSPTLGQSMKTGSQKAMESIGN